MKVRLPQGMGGGPTNMQSMIKQAQKMQEDMAAKQAELDQKRKRLKEVMDILNPKEEQFFDDLDDSDNTDRGRNLVDF